MVSAMTQLDRTQAPDHSYAMIAVMGATGTGKSTFIKLLTNDDKIVIGHKTESETSDITLSRYFDRDACRSVVLIDTPGFDDSHANVTDTDILAKIVDFLQSKEGGRKLNGIIYLHRISDPRLGGVSRKNLRMFRQLCGDDKLGNVRIVTTNWSRVSEKEGAEREEDLATSDTAFKPLMEAGAVLCRHYNTAETARSIVSQLVIKDPVLMQIQEELNKGMKLGATSAGAVITEELERLQQRHKKEIELLKKEMEKAARANDEALRAELAEERLELTQKMARAEEDRKRLEKTLDEARANLEMETRRLHEMHQRAAAESAKLREEMAAADREREKLAQDVQMAREKADVERGELNKRADEERKRHEEHIQDLHEKMLQEFNDREVMQRKLKEAEENAKAENARVMAKLMEEREMVIREAERENFALLQKAQEAERVRRELEEQVKEIEQKKKELEEEANRGLITRLFTESGGAMLSCVRTGEDTLGVPGAFGGMVLGMGVGPVVGVWRTMFGK